MWVQPLRILMATSMAMLALTGAERVGPIVIGVSNVQSGPSRSIGHELLQGSMAYFRFVNSRGGIHSRQISVVLRDDRYEPEPAVQNTNELITKQHAFFLFDYVGTPTLTRVLPLLRYYRAENVVNVAPFTGAAPQRTPPYAAYVFNIRASYQEEAETLVNYLFGKGFRRIGFLGQADAYGKSGEVSVEQGLQRYGLHITASVAYRRNSGGPGSMREQMEYLRRKGVDAVVAVGVYGACGEFIREARIAHWEIPIANLSFVDAEAMLSLLQAESTAAHMDLTRKLINSQVVPLPSDSQLPLVREYLTHLEEGRAGFTSLEGWLNAVVVAEALRRAGPNPTRRDFVKAMESLHGWDPGIGHKLEFSATEHQGLHTVWLTETKAGHWEIAKATDGSP